MVSSATRPHDTAIWSLVFRMISFFWFCIHGQLLNAKVRGDISRSRRTRTTNTWPCSIIYTSQSFFFWLDVLWKEWWIDPCNETFNHRKKYLRVFGSFSRLYKYKCLNVRNILKWPMGIRSHYVRIVIHSVSHLFLQYWFFNPLGTVPFHLFFIFSFIFIYIYLFWIQSYSK